MMLRFILITISFIVISGCASTSQQVGRQKPDFRDDLFPSYNTVNIETSEEIFALNPQAKDFIQTTQATYDSEVADMKNLIRQIFEHGEHGIQYQNDANSTATQTFENRAANCLSLTIMAYSMAQYAGFDVRFYEVDIPEYWTRREGVNLLNGHVNLRVGTHASSAVRNSKVKFVDVDFDPQAIRSHFERKVIGRNKVLAMFYNNKGADALIAKSLPEAYAYFRKAATLDDGFDFTWVNLGVLYRRIGALEEAKRSYEYAIALNEENLTAWENLAVLYQLQGKQDASQRIEKMIVAKRDENPFYHFILGEEALEQGKPEEALTHYKRARRLDGYRHEILFGIGKAYYELGDVSEAQKFMAQAAKNASNKDDEYRYLSKLSSLQSAR